MIRPLALASAAAIVVSGCTGSPPAETDPPPSSSVGATSTAGSGTEATTTATGPNVSASDQPLRDGAVRVGAVVDAPSFLVVHLDQDGVPGDVIGHADLGAGATGELVVPVDAALTPGDVLWAMLHIDGGEVGTYEFPGPDVPLRDAGGAVVMTPFEITDED